MKKIFIIILIIAIVFSIYSIWFSSPKLSGEYNRVDISSGRTGKDISITDAETIKEFVKLFNQSIVENSSGTKIKTYGYAYTISFNKSIYTDTFIIYDRESIWKSALFGAINVKYSIDKAFIENIDELF